MASIFDVPGIIVADNAQHGPADIVQIESADVVPLRRASGHVDVGVLDSNDPDVLGVLVREKDLENSRLRREVARLTKQQQKRRGGTAAVTPAALAVGAGVVALPQAAPSLPFGSGDFGSGDGGGWFCDDKIQDFGFCDTSSSSTSSTSLLSSPTL